ncbi:MAG TPA: hypothetical protein PKB09_01415 [Candidatus Saccharibacteria bacterium]|nr:hypothetical protein [Candidatus Saccharibacteria bacterium]
MIQRIKFGTVEQISQGGTKPHEAIDDLLVKQGLVRPDDYIIRFSSMLEAIPDLDYFSRAMELTGAECYYPSSIGDVPITAIKTSSANIKVSNGRDFTGNNGRIFQLGYNLIALSSLVHTGNEMLDFIDYSGALTAPNNTLR